MPIKGVDLTKSEEVRVTDSFMVLSGVDVALITVDIGVLMLLGLVLKFMLVVFGVVLSIIVIFHVFRHVLIGNVLNFERLSGLLGWLLFHFSDLLHFEFLFGAELLDPILGFIVYDQVDGESTKGGEFHALLDEVLGSLALRISKLDNVSDESW